jgi:hypothetical protein
MVCITSSCYNAVNFRSHGNFVNPSRVSPLNLLVRSVPGARTRYYLYTKDRMPAMCVSSVYCKESHLLAPPERGLRQKWMTGIFHSQEWERCVGLVCTTFKHRYVSAQIGQDAMQFSTRAFFGNRCGYNEPCFGDCLADYFFLLQTTHSRMHLPRPCL